MEVVNRYRRPNILFILTDDQHFRALGSARDAQLRTPYMDLLAREGAHLTHCYVSTPVSSASRASLFTGQYGFQNGVAHSGDPIHEGAPQLAHLLYDRGYQTSFVGKWDNDGRPTTHGFNHMRHVLLPGTQEGRLSVIQDGDAPPREITRHPSELFTDGALELIRKPMEEPFVLFLAYTAPQGPRAQLPAYDAMYPPDTIPLPPNYLPVMSARRDGAEPTALAPEVIMAETAHYYARISHLDAQLGRIVEFLKVHGQLDHTLIFLSSDNGLSLGAHGFVGKQSMYEECLRVPLIIRGPDIRSGVRCDALVNLMDLMPTMCDVGGALIPAGVQGRTLTPLLTGKREEHHTAVFGHYRDFFRMVRTRRYKLIRHIKTGREELFDLESDPYEMSNLAASPPHQNALKGLRELLAEWQQDVGDKGFTGQNSAASSPSPPTQ